MNLSKIQKSLNKTSRLVGDVNAVKKGTIHKRIKNRTTRTSIFGKLIKLL